MKTLVNGPAGENLVPFSCICSERYRQLGRGGMGAVLGSKNLKAIVVRGWLDVNVPDIEACMKLAEQAHQKDKVTSPDNNIYTDGTPVLVDYCQDSGMLPPEIFRRAVLQPIKISTQRRSKKSEHKKRLVSHVALPAVTL